MPDCKCGCGELVKGKRVFVNKEHQIRWLLAGGASELNAMLPDEVRSRGGQTSGRAALASGRLAEASQKGAERAKAIAEQVREAINEKKKP